MVSRQQLGDIFLGVTPKPVRDYMARAFRAARPKYQRLIIPCIGRFTVAESAIKAGWAPDAIETSDISLFSSVLGYEAAQKDLKKLGIRFHDELEALNAHADRDTLAAAVLFGLKYCQLRENSYYERIVRDEIWRTQDEHIAKIQKQVDTLAARLRGAPRMCEPLARS